MPSPTHHMRTRYAFTDEPTHDHRCLCQPFESAEATAKVSWQPGCLSQHLPGHRCQTARTGCKLGANQAYNITNGDFFRWEQIWEKVVDLFDLPLGPPQSISLQQFMADKTSTWRELAEVHGLVTPDIEKAVNWSFGDYIFNCDWDIMASTTKARQHGFESFEDSEHMFSQILTEMAQARMIPPL